MPELPDVENFRRYFEREALHKTVRTVSVLDTRILHGLTPEALGDAAEGRSFERTDRHGKHLFALLDSGRWLTFHFGMTGGFETFQDEAPRFTRLHFDFTDESRLAYVDQRLFGEIGLAGTVEDFLNEHELGTDALEMDEETLTHTVLSGTRTLKAALMDQSKIAGIGNEYSDEILFQARLHPQTHSDALSAGQVSRLCQSMGKVLDTAITKGAGFKGFEENLPEDFLLPHRGKDGTCPVCGAPLKSLKSGGRTAWFCPRCQPAP